MKYSTGSRKRKYVERYGFWSFARKFVDRYDKKLMDTAIKIEIEVEKLLLKSCSKKSTRSRSFSWK